MGAWGGAVHVLVGCCLDDLEHQVWTLSCAAFSLPSAANHAVCVMLLTIVDFTKLSTSKLLFECHVQGAPGSAKSSRSR